MSKELSSRTASPTYLAICLVVDAVLVVLFAALGNREHDSGLALGDLASTAWPFLVGLALGWVLTRSWTRVSQLWPAGVVVVAVTVTAGMVLRVLFTEGGAQLPFVLVAAGALGALLLGRRLITGLLSPAADLGRPTGV